MQQQNGGKCGICGENFSQVKQFEKGGKLYTGQIIKEYQQGEIIQVNVEITANHIGFFEFMICNVDGWQSDATQTCLEQTYLSSSNDGQTKIYIQYKSGYIYTKLRLPSHLTCNHCVLQWRYTAGNNWGTDQVTGQSGLGLGPQEQFYGCSDIRIKPNSGQIIVTDKPATSTSKQVSSTSASTNRPIVSTSTSTSSTSTNRPIVTSTASSTFTNRPITASNGKCLNGDGFYANPGCKSFYRCSSSGTANQQVFQFDCPTGLLFDESIKVCNWPSLVNCNNY